MNEFVCICVEKCKKKNIQKCFKVLVCGRSTKKLLCIYAVEATATQSAILTLAM